MIVIDNVIVSDELASIKFSCDLSACHGNCCVDGDEGAPLEEDEIGIIEDYIEIIENYMTPEGIDVVDRHGVFDYGIDGEYVTPLINDRECAFVFWENGISFCAIEKAFLSKEIDFRKPVSCHLYPIRVKKYDSFDAVNYHRWPICDPALKKGKSEGLPLYVTLKEPLLRKFGAEFYKKLVVEMESLK